MTRRETKLLKGLLRSKGAYTKFKLNRKRYRRTMPDLSACSIAAAFVWSDTPEGTKYWSKLNDELMTLRWVQALKAV